MNAFHQELLDRIKKRKKKEQSFYLRSRYSGSSHARYGLSVPESREISKTWAQKHKDISLRKFVALLHSLYEGKTTDEKKIAGQLLQYFPLLREQINPAILKNWLLDLEGWEEIDSLCQSVFGAKEILSHWSDWKKVISQFAKSRELSHKRASLVLLTGPVYQSSDEELVQLALENIELLKNEKSILITKAISWLLRSLIKNHRQKVELYMKSNAGTLPKIAFRETASKLEYGKKIH